MRLKTTWLVTTALLSTLIVPVATRESSAQHAGKVYQVGAVFAEYPPPPNTPPSPVWRAFVGALADHGYVRGKNLAFHVRFGSGYERLPELAAELVRLGVDVIYTAGTKTSRIVADAVKTTPVVFFSCDPLEHVVRLARPDANLTGSTCLTTELSPKRLELLKELVPSASRLVAFGDWEDAPAGLELVEDAAPRLGIELQAMTYEGRDHLPEALRAVAKERPDAVFVFPDPILVQERKQIAEFAVRHRLPAMYAFPAFAEAGGLMSYGASISEMLAIGAEQVAEILGGARPGAVPVRQATRFYLVINLKTAKAIGLEVPQSLLLRADKVIE